MRIIALALVALSAAATPAFAQEEAAADFTGFHISAIAGADQLILNTPNVDDPSGVMYGVNLGYDISRFKLAPGAGIPEHNAPFYVTLRKGPGDNWQGVAGSSQPPAQVQPDEVVIKGRVDYVAQPTPDYPSEPAAVGLHYGIESYFVPEGEGRKLEDARNAGKVTVVAAVTPSGRAAIKRLLLDGQPVYDEPWF